jgi:hypothetical protein
LHFLLDKGVKLGYAVITMRETKTQNEEGKKMKSMHCKVEEAVKRAYGENALPIGLKEIYETDWRIADSFYWEIGIFHLQKIINSFAKIHGATRFNIALIDNYGSRHEADFHISEVTRQPWEIWKESDGWKLQTLYHGIDTFKTKKSAEAMRNALQ